MTQQPGTRVPWRGDGAPGKSAGQLMKEVTEDLSTLVRKEIELAKQELGSSVAAKTQGAVMFAIVGVLGLFALIFVLLALRDGLDEFMWTWAADLVTAAVLLLIGVVAALVARKKLQTPVSADLTKKTIREDVEWAKTLGKR
ncbi:MAG TPA: phage holin family protein [Actinomycetota bacterium]|nr:phage holin family protein [Actinomycetota bacterium]